jgi:mannosyltransferase OCH1-like enzyme
MSNNFNYQISSYEAASVIGNTKLIPKNVFQTYKSRLVDKETFNKINSFRINNPTFNFHFHDDIDMEKYMAQNWGHRKIFEIFKNIDFGAAKADIWRYCILYQFGGVYLDFDSSIAFPLESIPSEANEIISFESNQLNSIISEVYTPNFNYLLEIIKKSNSHNFRNTALQWVIVINKKHAIIENVINLIEENSLFFENKNFVSVHQAICNFTGPVIFTVALHKYLEQGNDCTITDIDYNNMAVFKDYHSSSIYFNDKHHYTTKSNRIIYNTKSIRLNLGAGEDFKPGYLNIDANPKLPNIIQIDVSDLSNHFVENSINEILAKDILEHVGMPTAHRWLKEWCSLLVIDGILVVQTPCFDLLNTALTQNKINLLELNYYLFAGVSWNDSESSWDTELTTAYDWHRCCFTKEHLINQLKRLDMEIINVSLDNIEDMKPGNFTHGLNMTIKAKKIK